MPLTIGQVAKRSGIGLETIRFYERNSLRNRREQIRVTGSTRRKWLLASDLSDERKSSDSSSARFTNSSRYELIQIPRALM